MLEIKDIPKVGLNEPTFVIKWDDLCANIIEDGRHFCGSSFDSQWCCIGIIVDGNNNLENPNPTLQVNEVYKIRN